MHHPAMCRVIHQDVATDAEYIRDRISTYSFENSIAHASPCVTDSESESEHGTSDCEGVANTAPLPFLLARSLVTSPRESDLLSPALLTAWTT